MIYLNIQAVSIRNIFLSRGFFDPSTNFSLIPDRVNPRSQFKKARTAELAVAVWAFLCCFVVLP